MPRDMELQLNPNGDITKLTWRSDDGNWSKPVKLPRELLRARSRDVRKALSNLNDYVRLNPGLSEERDPGWERYSSALKALRDEGRALHSALSVDDDTHSKAFLQALQHLNLGAELIVHCSDDDVTLPLRFVFEQPGLGEALRLQGPPSRADFRGFWLERFNITMLVAGGGCEQSTLIVDPKSFRTLYALHKTDLDNALSYLCDDRDKLTWLIKEVEVKGAQYDWFSARSAVAKLRETNSVVFVLAHSDGDALALSDDSDYSKIDCQAFARMVHEGRGENLAALLVLNCCLSAAGSEQRSLLSAVAQRGFCGLIGTEAEILNTHALRCGIRLMWSLCREGKTLGESFVAMQQAEDLFPLNLFYTCYAERGFRLREPLSDEPLSEPLAA
jgi:hypothetical protein